MTSTTSVLSVQNNVRNTTMPVDKSSGEGHKLKRNWGDFCVKPSEAFSKHSLFGSNIEIFNTEERLELQKLDPSSYKEHPRQYKVRNLPPVLKAKVPDSSILQFNREQIDKQKRALSNVEGELKILEKNARYNPGSIPSNFPAQRKHMNTEEKRWFSEKDLKHSKDINILGVRAGLNGNYNRDKYGEKPPTHKYALIGDVLKSGNDFSDEVGWHGYDNSKVDAKMYSTSYSKHYPMVRSNYSIDNMQQKLDIAVDLPPNILHMFRTSECAKLLNNKDIVNNSLKELERLEQQRDHKTHMVLQPKTVKPKMKPLYEAMGSALRMDHFPGYTFNNKISSTKFAHSGNVFKNRIAETNEFKMQRDELSNWAESNVLRERMKKAWNQYLAEVLGKKKSTE